MKQKSMPTTAEIKHIHTLHDIHDVYGEDAFKAYLQKEITTGLEIQSKSTFADGTPSNCTPYELGSIWGTIIGKVTANKEINIGQMLRNYAHIKSTPEDRKAIFNTLFNISMTGVQDNHDMIEEVAVIGIGMMLKDNLDESNPMSIVHIMNSRAVSALASPTEPKQEAKVA